MSTTTYRPLTCEHCGTTENISWAAGVARLLCPDCYQQGAAAMSSTVTIEQLAEATKAAEAAYQAAAALAGRYPRVTRTPEQAALVREAIAAQQAADEEKERVLAAYKQTDEYKRDHRHDAE